MKDENEKVRTFLFNQKYQKYICLCKTGMKTIVPVHYSLTLAFVFWEIWILLTEWTRAIARSTRKESKECAVFKWIEPLIFKRSFVPYVPGFVLCTFHETRNLGKIRAAARPKTINLHYLQCFVSVVCYFPNWTSGLMVSALQMRFRNQT